MVSKPLSEYNDEELSQKLSELTKRLGSAYSMNMSPTFIKQIQLLIDTYRAEISNRKDKIADDEDYDDLINIE